MPGPVPKSGDDAGDNIKNTDEGKGDKGADPKKTSKPEPQPIDFSQVGDEDFDKVFDDPRLFKHSRFKKLNDRAKQATEYEKEQAEAEKKRLKDEGKLKELNEKLEGDLKKANEQHNNVLVKSKIQAEAAKQGAVDVEVVTSLIDTSKITVGDDGAIEGADEAVSTLLKEKPFLKGDGTKPPLGSPTSPGADSGTAPRRFRHSQIQDPEFFRENEAEIMKAIAAGTVEQDLPV